MGNDRNTEQTCDCRQTEQFKEHDRGGQSVGNRKSRCDAARDRDKHESREQEHETGEAETRSRGDQFLAGSARIFTDSLDSIHDLRLGAELGISIVQAALVRTQELSESGSHLPKTGGRSIKGLRDWNVSKVVTTSANV